VRGLLCSPRFRQSSERQSSKLWTQVATSGQRHLPVAPHATRRRVLGHHHGCLEPVRHGQPSRARWRRSDLPKRGPGVGRASRYAHLARVSQPSDISCSTLIQPQTGSVSKSHADFLLSFEQSGQQSDTPRFPCPAGLLSRKSPEMVATCLPLASKQCQSGKEPSDQNRLQQWD